MHERQAARLVVRPFVCVGSGDESRARGLFAGMTADMDGVAMLPRNLYYALKHVSPSIRGFLLFSQMYS
ncbi:MAG TPA: hypothetical protein VKM54_02450 [Myxococcota bacterium]|nr:hypothetical protein [Myxococcota bacterium]